MKKIGSVLFMVFALSCGLFLHMDSAKAAVQPTITPMEVVTGSENVLAKKYSYEVPAHGSTVVPLKVTKPGTLFVRINGSEVGGDIKVGLYTDAAGKSLAGSSWDCSFTADPNEVIVGDMPVSTARTYYLHISYRYDSTTNGAGSVSISPYLVSSADRTLAYNTWSAVPPKYNSRQTYARVNVTYNGYIGVAQQNTNGSGVSVALCNSAKNVLVNKSIAVNKFYYYPVKKGTYYIKTDGIYDGITTLKYVLTGGFSASQNKMLTVPILGTMTYDVKFKAEKTGLLNVTQFNNTSFYITLLNSKKKALSPSDFNWGRTNSYAVKKGSTYYFRLNASIGSDDRSISYSIAGASAPKNTSKKKAITLKKNKAKSIVLLSGDKKTHYFKIKMTKKKKLNLSFTTAGHGDFSYDLIKGSKRVAISRSGTNGPVKSVSKLKKGTYYFRIKLNTKSKSSGRFTLKLKS